MEAMGMYTYATVPLTIPWTGPLPDLSFDRPDPRHGIRFRSSQRQRRELERRTGRRG